LSLDDRQLQVGRMFVFPPVSVRSVAGDAIAQKQLATACRRLRLSGKGINL